MLGVVVGAAGLGVTAPRAVGVRAPSSSIPGASARWRRVRWIDVDLPTLATFRREESARFLTAAKRRLGLGR